MQDEKVEAVSCEIGARREVAIRLAIAGFCEVDRQNARSAGDPEFKKRSEDRYLLIMGVSADAETKRRVEELSKRE